MAFFPFCSTLKELKDYVNTMVESKDSGDAGKVPAKTEEASGDVAVLGKNSFESTIASGKP